MGSSWVHTAYSWISFWCRNFFIIWASARKSFGSMVPVECRSCAQLNKCMASVSYTVTAISAIIYPHPTPEQSNVATGNVFYKFIDHATNTEISVGSQGAHGIQTPPKKNPVYTVQRNNYIINMHSTTRKEAQHAKLSKEQSMQTSTNG